MYEQWYGKETTLECITLKNQCTLYDQHMEELMTVYDIWCEKRQEKYICENCSHIGYMDSFYYQL